MNGLNHDAVLQLQKEYPTGTRILLLHMEQDPRPIPDNTKGTVWHVDGIGQIHCRFDTGFGHTLVPGVDHFRKLTEGKEVEHQ
ncbi:DUF4314 domain-containing protein [uncultured Oscillibacter sp.]|uniref:DUF4314 domain-containing protein n=1 Tax=uncultured Oscillibacter sp. TaxID=876091 RepID=UPI00280C2BCC|nr:DUF4314 domain-containing protein [uncultured Oscillibacter sp.]